jgi:hypothetical protein
MAAICVRQHNKILYVLAQQLLSPTDQPPINQPVCFIYSYQHAYIIYYVLHCSKMVMTIRDAKLWFVYVASCIIVTGTYGLGDIFGVSPRLRRDIGCTCSCRSVRQPYNLISPPPCGRNSKLLLYICGQ